MKTYTKQLSVYKSDFKGQKVKNHVPLNAKIAPINIDIKLCLIKYELAILDKTTCEFAGSVVMRMYVYIGQKCCRADERRSKDTQFFLYVHYFFKANIFKFRM